MRLELHKNKNYMYILITRLCQSKKEEREERSFMVVLHLDLTGQLEDWQGTRKPRPWPKLPWADFDPCHPEQVLGGVNGVKEWVEKVGVLQLNKKTRVSVMQGVWHAASNYFIVSHVEVLEREEHKTSGSVVIFQKDLFGFYALPCHFSIIH